nr:MAG TPA: hypothetical protein [Caudoviricetes sp.]
MRKFRLQIDGYTCEKGYTCPVTELQTGAASVTAGIL